MLEEKILGDYKEAMKARDSLKSTLLSSLRAEFMNTSLAKKKDLLDDLEILGVINKLIKQHQDSITQFKQGNRLDLAEKETKELEILKAYLPPQLSEEEIKNIIAEAITSNGAQDMKDMGKVMKEVSLKTAGKADAKLVSDLVKARLTKA
ncbi:MAG: GatB/YqeY domain-containing protein [Candidatus Omnitrophota bacterium]